MELTELTCDGFRCLRDIEFRPGPGINVIRGDNAQGKTSLLEAILFLTTSKSHRTNIESNLVAHGSDAFHIAGQVRRRHRDVRLEAHWWKGAKRFRVNGVAQTRVSDILGKAHVVFFSPEDVGLVRGGASHRRRFLDMELSQLSPGYLRALQEYRQVLRQRNGVLRTSGADTALLDAWDNQLVRHGAVLTEERERFLGELSGRTAQAHARIAREEALALAYVPDVRAGASLREALVAARDSDRRQGFTARGPHRDDIEFMIEGKPARHFASQGQQRTVALALKLGELELVHAMTDEYPILMLDDVLSELDEPRSRRLFDAIPQEAQCLLTTTDMAPTSPQFGAKWAEFLIRAGRLEPQ